LKQRKQKNRLVIIFLVAEFLDLLTTVIGVYGMGIAEKNPLINLVPMWALLLYKVIAVSGVAVYLWKSSKMYLWVYWVLCIFTVGVAFWNGIVLLGEL
jgi:hypothetical protein